MQSVVQSTGGASAVKSPSFTNSLTGLGRWLYIAGISIYVLLHFTKPDVGAKFVPSYFPFPYFWNYITGIAILAFIVSVITGKWDKLAALLMALYIFLMTVLIHVPNTIAGTDPNEFVNIFRNLIAMGGALMYAGGYARDKRFVG